MCELLNIDELAKKLNLTRYGVVERLRRAGAEGAKFEEFLPKPQRRLKNEKYTWNKQNVDNWLKEG